MTPTQPAALRHCAGLLAAAALAALAACSSAPPVPDWQMNAHGAAEKALQAYLAGQARVEQREWERARAEVARTARADLLARLELMRCAAEVASLVPGPCERFEALRADAAPPELAYASYLAGRVAPQQVALLPPAHRPVAALLAGGADVRQDPGAALAAVPDPLARLVAAGALFQAGRAGPQVMGVAADTASQQGWRRPLLAWLLLQLRHAEAGGDTQAAAALRRRIDLVDGPAASGTR